MCDSREGFLQSRMSPFRFPFSFSERLDADCGGAYGLVLSESGIGTFKSCVKPTEHKPSHEYQKHESND